MGTLIHDDGSDSSLARVGPQGISKIKEYKLDELVSQLYLEGFRPPTIAKKCNELLEQRPDEKEYFPINATNVTVFIRQHLKNIQNEVPYDLQLMSKNLPDLGDNLTRVVNIINAELEKLRDPNNKILGADRDLFIRLIREFNHTLQLIGNIQGATTPSISMAAFSEHVRNLCNRVKGSTAIPDNSKSLVLTMIAEELISESLLTKPIEGTVIDVNTRSV